MVAREAGRIAMDLERFRHFIVMSMYSVTGTEYTIILVYIALHILLLGGINLFDLLCVFFAVIRANPLLLSGIIPYILRMLYGVFHLSTISNT